MPSPLNPSGKSPVRIESLGFECDFGGTKGRIKILDDNDFVKVIDLDDNKPLTKQEVLSLHERAVEALVQLAGSDDAKEIDKLENCKEAVKWLTRAVSTAQEDKVKRLTKDSEKSVKGKKLLVRKTSANTEAEKNICTPAEYKLKEKWKVNDGKIAIEEKGAPKNIFKTQRDSQQRELNKLADKIKRIEENLANQATEAKHALRELKMYMSAVRSEDMDRPYRLLNIKQFNEFYKDLESLVDLANAGATFDSDIKESKSLARNSDDKTDPKKGKILNSQENVVRTNTAEHSVSDLQKKWVINKEGRLDIEEKNVGSNQFPGRRKFQQIELNKIAERIEGVNSKETNTAFHEFRRYMDAIEDKGSKYQYRLIEEKSFKEFIVDLNGLADQVLIGKVKDRESNSYNAGSQNSIGKEKLTEKSEAHESSSITRQKKWVFKGERLTIDIEDTGVSNKAFNSKRNRQRNQLDAVFHKVEGVAIDPSNTNSISALNEFNLYKEAITNKKDSYDDKPYRLIAINQFNEFIKDLDDLANQIKAGAQDNGKTKIDKNSTKKSSETEVQSSGKGEHEFNQPKVNKKWDFENNNLIFKASGRNSKYKRNLSTQNAQLWPLINKLDTLPPSKDSALAATARSEFEHCVHCLNVKGDNPKYNDPQLLNPELFKEFYAYLTALVDQVESGKNDNIDDSDNEHKAQEFKQTHSTDESAQSSHSDKEYFAEIKKKWGGSTSELKVKKLFDEMKNVKPSTVNIIRRQQLSRLKPVLEEGGNITVDPNNKEAVAAKALFVMYGNAIRSVSGNSGNEFRLMDKSNFNGFLSDLNQLLGKINLGKISKIDNSKKGETKEETSKQNIQAQSVSAISPDEPQKVESTKKTGSASKSKERSDKYVSKDPASETDESLRVKNNTVAENELETKTAVSNNKTTADKVEKLLGLNQNELYEKTGSSNLARQLTIEKNIRVKLNGYNNKDGKNKNIVEELQFLKELLTAKTKDGKDRQVQAKACEVINKRVQLLINELDGNTSKSTMTAKGVENGQGAEKVDVEKETINTGHKDKKVAPKLKMKDEDNEHISKKSKIESREVKSSQPKGSVDTLTKGKIKPSLAAKDIKKIYISFLSTPEKVAWVDVVRRFNAGESYGEIENTYRERNYGELYIVELNKVCKELLLRGDYSGGFSKENKERKLNNQTLDMALKVDEILYGHMTSLSNSAKKIQKEYIDLFDDGKVVDSVAQQIIDACEVLIELNKQRESLTINEDDAKKYLDVAKQQYSLLNKLLDNEKNPSSGAETNVKKNRDDVESQQPKEVSKTKKQPSAVTSASGLNLGLPLQSGIIVDETELETIEDKALEEQELEAYLEKHGVDSEANGVESLKAFFNAQDKGKNPVGRAAQEKGKSVKRTDSESDSGYVSANENRNANASKKHKITRKQDRKRAEKLSPKRLGKSAEDVIGKHYSNKIPDDVTKAMDAKVKEGVANKKAMFERLSPLRDKEKSNVGYESGYYSGSDSGEPLKETRSTEKPGGSKTLNDKTIDTTQNDEREKELKEAERKKEKFSHYAAKETKDFEEIDKQYQQFDHLRKCMSNIRKEFDDFVNKSKSDKLDGSEIKNEKAESFDKKSKELESTLQYLSKLGTSSKVLAENYDKHIGDLRKSIRDCAKLLSPAINVEKHLKAVDMNVEPGSNLNLNASSPKAKRTKDKIRKKGKEKSVSSNESLNNTVAEQQASDTGKSSSLKAGAEVVGKSKATKDKAKVKGNQAKSSPKTPEKNLTGNAAVDIESAPTLTSKKAFPGKSDRSTVSTDPGVKLESDTQPGDRHKLSGDQERKAQRVAKKDSTAGASKTPFAKHQQGITADVEFSASGVFQEITSPVWKSSDHEGYLVLVPGSFVTNPSKKDVNDVMTISLKQEQKGKENDAIKYQVVSLVTADREIVGAGKETTINSKMFRIIPADPSKSIKESTLADNTPIAVIDAVSQSDIDHPPLDLDNGNSDDLLETVEDNLREQGAKSILNALSKQHQEENSQEISNEHFDPEILDLSKERFQFGDEEFEVETLSENQSDYFLKGHPKTGSKLTEWFEENKEGRSVVVDPVKNADKQKRSSLTDDEQVKQDLAEIMANKPNIQGLSSKSKIDPSVHKDGTPTKAKMDEKPKAQETRTRSKTKEAAVSADKTNKSVDKKGLSKGVTEKPGSQGSVSQKASSLANKKASAKPKHNTMDDQEKLKYLDRVLKENPGNLSDKEKRAQLGLEEFEQLEKQVSDQEAKPKISEATKATTGHAKKSRSIARQGVDQKSGLTKPLTRAESPARKQARASVEKTENRGKRSAASKSANIDAGKKRSSSKPVQADKITTTNQTRVKPVQSKDVSGKQAGMTPKPSKIVKNGNKTVSKKVHKPSQSVQEKKPGRASQSSSPLLQFRGITGPLNGDYSKLQKKISESHKMHSRKAVGNFLPREKEEKDEFFKFPEVKKEYVKHSKAVGQLSSSIDAQYKKMQVFNSESEASLRTIKEWYENSKNKAVMSKAISEARSASISKSGNKQSQPGKSSLEREIAKQFHQELVAAYKLGDDLTSKYIEMLNDFHLKVVEDKQAEFEKIATQLESKRAVMEEEFSRLNRGFEEKIKEIKSGEIKPKASSRKTTSGTTSGVDWNKIKKDAQNKKGDS